MKTKVFCVTGALASWRSRENTLTNFVQLALNNKTTDIETFGCMSIRKAIRAVNEAVGDGFNVLVVAKSLGAYKMWNRVDRIKIPKLQIGQSIPSIVLVDPHFFAVETLDVMDASLWKVTAKCFYQRCKRMRGAHLPYRSERLEDTDHFAIADITTKAGRQVADYVRAEFVRLER